MERSADIYTQLNLAKKAVCQERMRDSPSRSHLLPWKVGSMPKVVEVAGTSDQKALLNTSKIY